MNKLLRDKLVGNLIRKFRINEYVAEDIVQDVSLYFLENGIVPKTDTIYYTATCNRCKNYVSRNREFVELNEEISENFPQDIPEEGFPELPLDSLPESQRFVIEQILMDKKLIDVSKEYNKNYNTLKVTYKIALEKLKAKVLENTADKYYIRR